jgi:hypothetical protein
MKTIKFNCNWNGKLNNQAFTTLRLRSKKYVIGTKFIIDLLGEIKGVAELKNIHILKLEHLNDFITYLDTGYDVEKTKELLQTIYKDKNIDWKTQYLCLCLLVYVPQ